MYEMDPKAFDRAKKLAKDARKKTWKYVTLGAAKRGWSQWRERNSKKGFVLRAIITGGVSYGATIGGAAAAAAIGSATVLASVASFGIGPVIVGLAGFAVKKGIDEFSYQRAARKVKAAVKRGQKPDIELIVPLTLKVLKKFSRAKRRRSQLRKGFFGRGLAKIRHARTSWRSWRKSKKGLYHGHKEFSDIADAELYERLMELRYYGQITFNLVHHLMDTVIQVRDQYATAMNQLFLHTIRQVHVTGHHEHCGDKCYTVSKKDWEKNLRRIEKMAKATTGGVTQFSSTIDQGTLARYQAFLRKKTHARKSKLDASSLLSKIEKSSRDLDSVETPDGLVKTIAKGGVKSEFKRRAITNPLLSATKLSSKKGSGFSDLVSGGYKAVDITKASELGKASGKFGITGGAGIVFDEVTTFVKNKWIRRKVLKTKDAGLGLLEATDEAGAQAFSEVYKNIIKKGVAQDQLTRLAQKVIHYYKKMDSMDAEFRENILKPMKFWGTPKFKDIGGDPESPFDSCSQAWYFNSTGFHVFNNYNKYLVHLIYFEALMLNLDKQVTKMLPEVVSGSVIKSGIPDWPKPRHLALRHGDLPLTSDSKELQEEEEDDDEEETEEELLDALAPMRRELMKKRS